MHDSLDILHKRLAGPARMACVLGLAGAFALGNVPAALAATQQTESKLARLSSEVQSATSTYAQASQKAEKLQKQIDDMADEIIDLEQDALPAQQRRASEAASNLYKMQTESASVFSMLLSSNSMNDFLTLSRYLGEIQDVNNSELERLNKLEDKLNSKMDKLSSARDKAEAQRSRANVALSSAKAAQAQMEQQAASEDAAAAAAEQAAAAKEAIEQAEKEHGSTAPGESTGPVDNSGGLKDPAKQEKPSDNGASKGDEPAQKPDTPSSGGSNNQPSKPQEPAEKPDNGGGSDQGGWLSGVASHYGTGDGFMGGITASGEYVTETSMGIAMLNVPLGTRVEIRYGGRSCVAVVNDRGPYIHGRVIDMQPAVARALGFLSVGVGTVEYRFL